ncbi:MAG: PAS domain-containing protein [Dehalococcoidia bacterium]|nr:PAS domain-containing protein [Dehalococcoidia bacterium]
MYAIDVTDPTRLRVLVVDGPAAYLPSLPDVDLIERDASGGGEVDCVLLGPVPLEAARDALARLEVEHGPPVVVLLADGGEADCARMLEAGAYDCFAASIDSRRLRQALGRAAETHRLRLDAARRRAELDSVLAHAGLGVARIAVNGHVLSANAHLEGLLGYGPGQLEGVEWRALFDGDSPDGDLAHDAGARERVARHRDGHGVALRVEVQLIGSEVAPGSYYLLHCTAAVDVPPSPLRPLGGGTPLFRALRAASASTYEVDLVHPERTTAFGIHPLIQARPTSAEASGAWWVDHIHPEDVQAFRRARREQIADAGAGPSRVRYRVRRGDGRWVTVDDHREVVRDDEGRAVKLVGTIIDVTERAAVESELAHSEERFRLAADATNALVYEADLQRGRVTVVRGLTEVLGYRSRGRLRIRWWREIVHPDDVDQYQYHLADQLEQGGSRRLEYRMRNAAGEWRHVEDYRRVVMAEDGVSARIVGTVIDVTDRRLAAEALRESDLRLREAFRAAELGAWSYDLDRDELYWDETMRELYGLPPEEVVTFDAFEARIHPEDHPTLPTLADAPDRGDFEFRVIRPDGEVRWIHASDRAEYDTSGRVVRRSGLNRDITTQKLAQDELREAAERLRLAQEVAGIGVLTALIADEALVLDEQAMRIFGLDTPRVANRDQLRRIHPDDRERLIEIVQRSQDPEQEGFGQDYLIEYRYLRPDGAWRWIQGRGRTFFEARGDSMRAVRAIVTVQDLTEQRAAEAALRESEQRERLARTIAGIGVLSWDAARDTLEWGPRARELFGVAEEFTSPSALFERLHPDDYPRLAQELAHALDPARHPEDDDFETEGRLIDPDGMVRWVMVRARVFFVGQGSYRRPSRVLSTVQDITERKRVEEEMLDREQRLQLALELGQLGTVTYYPDRDRLEWGPRARAMNGLTDSVTSLRGFLEGVHPDDRERVLTEMRESLTPSRDGGVFDGEYRIVLASGEVRWLYRRVAVVFQGSGHLRRARRVLITLRDLTERRRFEQAQQEFLAMASHELRNPLAALKGYASLMLRRGRYDEAGARAIVQQANHLERLVRDLLDITTATTGHFRLRLDAVDLVEVARTAVNEQQRTTMRHRVQLRQAPTELIGVWDADRVHQILTNLLSNAIKYSPDGGDVAVDIVPTEVSVRIRVEDQGIGIAPDERETIFQRFYRVESQTGRTEGLGLGLDVTRALVEAHRGRIELESEVGKGSVFTVLLPIDAPAEPDPPAASGGEAPASGQRVLVVDDDALVRGLLQHALLEDGYEVAVAGHGIEALELLEEQDFDVLVTDLMMPHMDGATLVRTLRERGRAEGLGIVIASAAYSAREQAAALGADGLVEKPFDLQRLSLAVREALTRALPGGRPPS